MTHMRMAWPMGLAMGAMVPAMAHGPMAGAGLAFVAAHLAVALGLAALVLVAPRARVWVARHRPSRAMLGRMVFGMGLGFAVICVHCLVTWHGSGAWS
ncbi:hypothetical protein [Jannaschia formosa]|uniref:hypothetical protein n=1 Tax=Jannaschia formosa TaxID=2259592 RepID=UPI000E1BAA40|nr:hypothetical protein [Jannaschia formosa]TFL20118.1 hypothetical protein DR046_01865 [Jannaschia formosa]